LKTDFEIKFFFDTFNTAWKPCMTSSFFAKRLYAMWEANS